MASLARSTSQVAAARPRRAFLRQCGACGLAVAAADVVGGDLFGVAAAESLAALARSAPRARYWISGDGAGAAACDTCHAPGSVPTAARPAHARRPVRCQLCARECLLVDGERGLCRARLNVKGELRSLVYGRPMTLHLDPIEKKPFFHFLPGRAALSFGTSGCPLRCKFCQNWELSQARPEDYDAAVVAPERLARAAVERAAPVIAFTYNEPTVFTEYLTDVARAARPLGRRCVAVSCGYMQEAPLAEMCAVLDAVKIDLKGFREGFYREVSSAELQPVLRSIRQLARSRVHLELVNLVVPTLNDAPADLAELSRWVAGEAGPDVPLHFTRFHPDYQLPDLPPTPVATLERAREAALRAGLRYVYVGNVPGHAGNNTYCPKCGRAVIERDGIFLSAIHLKDGRCPACATRIPGVWS
jgi:pyruvate formate lyase activating enzyme